MARTNPPKVGATPGASRKDDQKMVDKINQKLSASEDSLFSRMLGAGLIVLGVLLVILAIVVVVLARKDPKVDDSLTIPTVQVDRYTREFEVDVEGETDEKGRVMIWLDDDVEETSVRADSDGLYEYLLELEEEGEYEVTVATVSGWLVRKRSPKSNVALVELDRTAPSSKVELNYSSTSDDGGFDLTGEAQESGLTVILKGDKEYTATTDRNGEFAFSDIPLEEGSNSFTVVLEDKAGNQKELARKVEVTSQSAGDVNGDGVFDAAGTNELPEAAGELGDALSALFANKLMVIFGLIAAAVLAVNSTMVYKKMNA